MCNLSVYIIAYLRFDDILFFYAIQAIVCFSESWQSVLLQYETMAATINRNASAERKPQLLKKLEGHQDEINAAIALRHEDGVISVSDDK